MASGGIWRVLFGRLFGSDKPKPKVWMCLKCGVEVSERLWRMELDWPSPGWRTCMVCGFRWVCDDDGGCEYKGVKGMRHVAEGCLLVVESRDE